MLRLADDGRSFALLVNSESGQHGKPKRSSAKCSASTEMTPSSEKHYGWIIFSPLRAVFLMSPFMPWSCHAAECRGKRRRHRSPKWKTGSKQARQTCGRRTNANGATVTDRKMPLWGNISTENWSGIVKRTESEGERKSDCLSDSPSSSHLPHLESKLAPFKCV